MTNKFGNLFKLVATSASLATFVLAGVQPVAAASLDDDSSTSAATPSAAPSATSSDLSIKSDIRQADDLMVQGSYPEAEEAFKRLLITQPDNVEALAGLGYALGRQYKLNEADEQFDKVLAAHPDNPVAHCGKAMVLLYRVEKNELGSMSKSQALKAAGKECNKALDADPRVVEAHYLLGTVYKEEGRLDLATQAFGGAIRLDPHYIRAYTMLAAVQIAKGSMPEAIEEYKQALAMQPKSVSAHLGLADVYKKERRWDEASTQINAVLSTSPKNASAHLAMAQILEARGELDGAMREYEMLKTIKPSESESYLGIARISEQQSDYRRAADELQTALKMMPGNATVQDRLAGDMLKIGQIDEAFRFFLTILPQQPVNDSAVSGIVVCSYVKCLQMSPPTFTATADFKNAAQIISQLSKANPSDQILHIADLTMNSMAGGALTALTPPPAGLNAKLLNAVLLLSQQKFNDASTAFAEAINGSLTADDVLTAADTALVLHELDSAESGYRRAITFVGQEKRAQHGLTLVAAARGDANESLTRGNTLLNTRQNRDALDKYHLAIVANPRLAAARLGLAEAMERVAPSVENPIAAIEESIYQYQCYLALSPSIPAREDDRVRKRMAKLQDFIVHAKNTPPNGMKALLQRLSVTR